MPHQCVRCNTFYADDAAEIINGCTNCEGKLFFYVKQAKVDQARQTVEALTEDQKEEIHEQVADVLGRDVDEAEPVVVNLESIRMTKQGKYELDLTQLFNTDKPVIYKLGDGQYVVDLVETFQRFSKKK